MDHLRRLAIFVDEPVKNSFCWVMIENDSDVSAWVDVRRGEVSFDTWVEAFDAGTVELLKLVTDERVGPRALGPG